jgi:spore coat protein U-like protein
MALVKSRSLRMMLLCAIVSALLASSGSAWAVCQVTATPISFGNYGVLGHAEVTSVGTISYTCYGPAPAGIKIVVGPGNSGSVARRAMLVGRQRLPYVLSLDPRGQVPWGDGRLGTQVYYDRHPPRNRTVTVLVYGRVPPGQRVVPNSLYRDNVSIVASY